MYNSVEKTRNNFKCLYIRFESISPRIERERERERGREKKNVIRYVHFETDLTPLVVVEKLGHP